MSVGMVFLPECVTEALMAASTWRLGMAQGVGCSIKEGRTAWMLESAFSWEPTRQRRIRIEMRSSFKEEKSESRAARTRSAKVLGSVACLALAFWPSLTNSVVNDSGDLVQPGRS